MTAAGEDGTYSYFSFTKALAAETDTINGGWDAIAASRFGAPTDVDYEVNDSVLGAQINLGADGTATSFKIPAGTYGITVDLDKRYVMIIKEDVTIVGDVNNDGTVDVADVTALINYILGDKETVTINTEAADVNHDDTIDVSDVTALINQILGN